MIYAPKFVNTRRIDTPVSQIDVLPTLLGLLDFSYESHFYGQDMLEPNYESRYFVSNYQKIGYTKGKTTVILKPVRQYSSLPADASSQQTDTLLEEAIAFYQTAAGWQDNLRSANEIK